MSDIEERDGNERSQGPVTTTGSDAIKWSAIVLIVLAILYFLARYVMPLFG